MTERERMLAGELYDASDAELVAMRARAAELLSRHNHGKPDVLCELLGSLGSEVELRPPFFCDYGTHLQVADRVFANFGLVVLDCAEVTIGEAAQLGPYVQLIAADHPRDAASRRAGRERAAPVHLGANTWIGASAVIGPGVSVGEDSIVGAGSVVLRDVPAGVVVAGAPARVVRAL